MTDQPRILIVGAGALEGSELDDYARDIAGDLSVSLPAS